MVSLKSWKISQSLIGNSRKYIFNLQEWFSIRHHIDLTSVYNCLTAFLCHVGPPGLTTQAGWEHVHGKGKKERRKSEREVSTWKCLMLSLTAGILANVMGTPGSRLISTPIPSSPWLILPQLSDLALGLKPGCWPHSLAECLQVTLQAATYSLPSLLV